MHIFVQLVMFAVNDMLILRSQKTLATIKTLKNELV